MVILLLIPAIFLMEREVAWELVVERGVGIKGGVVAGGGGCEGEEWVRTAEA